ncbi:MAG: type II 3-dehydroquinate dehydratase, partial [Candidatus Borkfalkiaceae bacterium]|nr:type II 3-dehydroquinate dehydratase [Christensenellaceae bacterium]
MRKILVINGANLNMLGIREKTVYGEKTYRDLVEFIKKSAKERGLKVKIFQSNHEGKIVDEIQKAYCRYDGIIINA